jgi:hypothetical protein
VYSDNNFSQPVGGVDLHGDDDYVYVKVIAQNGTTFLCYKVHIHLIGKKAELTGINGGAFTSDVTGIGTVASPKTVSAYVPSSRISLGVYVSNSATVYLCNSDFSSETEYQNVNLAIGENHIYLKIVSESKNAINYYHLIVTKNAPL